MTYQLPSFKLQPLKFENGNTISSNTLQGMWLLIHAENKVNPC